MSIFLGSARFVVGAEVADTTPCALPEMGDAAWDRFFTETPGERHDSCPPTCVRWAPQECSLHREDLGWAKCDRPATTWVGARLACEGCAGATV